ncbi:MAG: ribosome recycling factor [Pseudomonadota bacterium]
MLEQLKKDTKSGMDKAIEALKNAFLGLRTGRVSVNLLDRVKAEVYGVMTPIQQLGNISAPEPRLLVVEVYDKNAVKAVEKAIRESSLGLSPNPDGCIIRMAIPELTKERREELVKLASKYAEEGRVSVRAHRHDALDQAKKSEKEHDLSEDDLERFKKEIQKLTDDYCAKIDEISEQKKKDIMVV